MSREEELRKELAGIEPAELERVEHKGTLEILPPHIEVRSRGITIGRGTSKQRQLLVEQDLRCIGCDGETTLHYRWADDPVLQERYDGEIAQKIVGFVSEHPSKDHRMHRGRPRRPL